MSFRPSRVFLFILTALLLAVASFALTQSADDARRDTWQRPQDVMDALGVHAGSHVADVGCGDGYFVMHLGRRAGTEGVVYGVDVDEAALRRLRQRVEDAGLSNVRIIHGGEADPQLPAASLDAVLIVNAYHEMRQYDSMLRAIFIALKPHGRLAIVDAPGKNTVSRDQHQRKHTIAEAHVREDAQRNNFRFLRKEADMESPREDSSSRGAWFFLLFEKPGE